MRAIVLLWGICSRQTFLHISREIGNAFSSYNYKCHPSHPWWRFLFLSTTEKLFYKWIKHRHNKDYYLSVFPTLPYFMALKFYLSCHLCSLLFNVEMPKIPDLTMKIPRLETYLLILPLLPFCEKAVSNFVNLFYSPLNRLNLQNCYGKVLGPFFSLATFTLFAQMQNGGLRTKWMKSHSSSCLKF